MKLNFRKDFLDSIIINYINDLKKLLYTTGFNRCQSRFWYRTL